MNDSFGLAQLQQWMQAVITHPRGVVVAADGTQARDIIDLAGDQLERIVTRSDRLSAAHRLEVYARSYFARLLDCFRAEYSCLNYLLGDELFERFVIDFLVASPPRSYTLNDLARHFPAHLSNTRPETTADEQAWPDLIIDVAHLERKFLETYDGPGPENCPLLSPEAIADCAWPELASRQFTPAIAVDLLTSSYPISEYYLSFRRGDRPARPAPTPDFAVIGRRHYHVFIHTLTEVEFRLLDKLIAGETLGHALADALENSATEQPPSIEDVRRWLREWTCWGLFAAISALPQVRR